MAQISFDRCMQLIDACKKEEILKPDPHHTDCVLEYDAKKGKWTVRPLLDVILEVMSEREKRNELIEKLQEKTGKKFRFTL